MRFLSAVAIILTFFQSAFALLPRSLVSRANVRSSSTALDATLTDLCQISKEACDAVAPMLLAFYKRITAGETTTAKLKADATFFSIADGIVQHMFIEHLFKGDKFGQIVGEEDETKINIKTKPYTVDDLVVPSEFDELIETTLKKIQDLSNKIDSNSYKDITIFVDPIDGTREFATGQGEFVTVLIGYNDPTGRPAAGIMYRPLTEPPTWAAGSARENCVMGVLDMATDPKPNGLLVTDGKESNFLIKAVEELGFEKIPSLASGNRAMMILEGKAAAYIRDTGGFSKWDTSGPQAVIEAYGGTMSKLPAFLKDKSLETYTHLKATKNLDYQENLVTMTMTNAKDKSIVKVDKKVIANDVNMLKEYSCLCGLVALNKDQLENNLDKIHKALNAAAAVYPPYYT